jgi:zinc protease
VKGFTPAQLRKAMRQVVVGEINTRKTMSGQASRLGAAEVVVGDIDYSRAYFERLRAVRPADLQRVLKTYLQAARLTSISLNPIESAAPAIAAAPALAARPDFSEITLSNGARLLLQPDAHLPNLHLRLAVTGGPLFEVAGQRGATALLATLLTKDAGKRTAAQVAQFIEEVGGSFYPLAGNNSLGVAAEVLPPDFARALAVIADAVLAPKFKPVTFKLEQEAHLAGLAQDADDVVTVARKLTERGAKPDMILTTGDCWDSLEEQCLQTGGYQVAGAGSD